MASQYFNALVRVTSCNSVWNSLERRALTLEVCMVHVYGANRERLYLLDAALLGFDERATA